MQSPETLARVYIYIYIYIVILHNIENKKANYTKTVKSIESFVALQGEEGNNKVNIKINKYYKNKDSFIKYVV